MTDTHPGIGALRRLQSRARVLETCAVHLRRAGLGDIGGLWADRDFAERVTMALKFRAPGTPWEEMRVDFEVNFDFKDPAKATIHLDMLDPQGHSAHAHFDDTAYDAMVAKVAEWRDLHTPGVQSEWDN